MLKKNKLIVLLVLVIMATGFIFSNSLKNSEESHAASGVIVEFVEPVLEQITDSEFIASFIVRKAAHLAEFCLLGLLVMATVVETKKKLINIAGYGLFYLLAVAVTDEFIQSFSDRTSSVSDVLIDFTGAISGFCAYIVISYCITKINQRKLNVIKKGIDDDSKC